MATLLKDTSRISKTTGKKVTDYVDNEKFTSALHEYATRQRTRIEQGLPQEQIPEYIGACILKIVDGCGSRANFRNYTYLDEMKGDAIIAAVKAVPKFNSEKSKNGYGFITFCVWRDMVNRIVLEKKQQDIKTSMMIDPTIDFFDTMGNNDNNINITKENAVDTYHQGKL